MHARHASSKPGCPGLEEVLPDGWTNGMGRTLLWLVKSLLLSVPWGPSKKELKAKSSRAKYRSWERPWKRSLKQVRENPQESVKKEVK